MARKFFACRACWYRLPFAVRQAISSAYGRDEAAHVAAMQAAIDWYATHRGVRT